MRSWSDACRSRRGRRHHDSWSCPHRVQQNLSFVIIPLNTITAMETDPTTGTSTLRQFIVTVMTRDTVDFTNSPNS
jgi:hypothetical protein